MELFVAHGANVNKTNAAGEQALLHAAGPMARQSGRGEMAAGARSTSQSQAVAVDRTALCGVRWPRRETALYLIERGADINARSAPTARAC